MVKFENQLKHHQIPEWAGNYIDYENLLNIIYSIVSYRAATDQINIENDRVENNSKLKSAFNVLVKPFIKQNDEKMITNSLNSNTELKQNLIEDNNNIGRDSFNSINKQEIFHHSEVTEDIVDIHLKEEKRVINLFIDEFKQNILKVDGFYNGIYTDIKQKLEKLNSNYKSMKEKKAGKLENDSNLSFVNLDGIGSVNLDKSKEKILRSTFQAFHAEETLKSNERTELKLGEKNDEFGFSTSWRRAYGELYNKSTWLHGFSAIIRKFSEIFEQNLILKSGKNSKVHLNELKILINELDSISNKTNFISELDLIVEFRKEIIDYFANFFFKGDKNSAIDSLEEKLIGGFPKEMRLICFASGMIVSLVIFIIALIFIPGKILFKQSRKNMNLY